MEAEYLGTEEKIGSITFISESPLGADENFTLTFEYNAEEGLQCDELVKMCRAFAGALGFHSNTIERSFEDPYGEFN